MLALGSRKAGIARRGRLGLLGWLLFACLVLPPLIMTGWQVFVAILPDWTSEAYAIAALVCFVLTILLTQAATASGSEEQVSVEDGALRMTNRLIPSERIETGLVVPRATGARVELRLDDGATAYFDVGSVEQAEEVLRQLGVCARTRTVEVCTKTAFPPGIVMAWAGVAGVIAAMGLAERAEQWLGNPPSDFVLSAAITLGGLAVALALRPTRVVIGSDGLILRRRLGSTFLPYDSVASVEHSGRNLVLQLRDQKPVTLRFGWASTEYVEAAVARLRTAMEVGGTASASAALPERGDLDVAAWRGVLGDLLGGDGGYRSKSITADEALAIAADPASSWEHRIGAALALQDGGALNDEGRKRLRLAAEASAHPSLRIGLSSIADAEVDEEAIEELLAEEQG